jgi:hypothetical protein
MPLCKKGEGRAIHISDFIVEQTGQIALGGTKKPRMQLSLQKTGSNTLMPVKSFTQGKTMTVGGLWNILCHRYALYHFI